jgi:hypothetical protein
MSRLDVLGVSTVKYRTLIAATGIAVIALFLTIMMAITATTLPAFAQNRSNGFTTRPGGARLCPNYAVIKNAKAAGRAVDEKWLASTGCVLALEGWRVALIDAPINRYDFKMIWHGRVFPPGSSDGVDVYFDQNDVATAALFDDFFSTQDAAEHWATANLKQRDIPSNFPIFPYAVMQTTKGFRISLGPASWLALTQFCESRKANSRCWVIGQPPD